jgi:sirohydrochlorin ferrochelatase
MCSFSLVTVHAINAGESIFDLLCSMCKNQLKDTLVELVFLKLTEPILYSAVESLIKQGANNIKIVLVFWAR